MVILKAENISKQYRLGNVGTGSLSHDINRWWHKVRGKEDPYLKIGALNDRSAKASQDYVWAIKDINYEVKKGEVLGIIGKNGAGKSTLLKILSRVTSPTTGSIKTKGRIASLLEVGTGFHPELTGKENIYLNGAILGMNKAEINSKIDEIIAFSGCQMYIDTPVKRYSSGMRVRLAFAVAAFLEPDILVIDEVLAVGDAEFQKKAIGKMQDISKGDGRTVIFVSHNMAAVRNLCSRGIVLEHGVIVFEGNQNAAVDYYLSLQDGISFNETIVKPKHRLNNNSRLVELQRVIAIKKTRAISYQLKLKKNSQVNQIFFISGTISKMDGSAVGSFFSDSISMVEDFTTVDLVLQDTGLTQGDYYLGMSISQFQDLENKIVHLDQAFEVIGLKIMDTEDHNNNRLKWNSSWGAIRFKATLNIN